MKQFIYKVFISALLMFFISSVKLFPQDSVKVNSFEDSPVKKGSWAFVFELGKFFGNSASFEGYNFLVKYHIGDFTALRINAGFNGGENINNYNKNYNFQFNATLQYFLTKKYFAKPFVSVGPFYNQDYLMVDYTSGHDIRYNSYDLGIIFTIGSEAFIYKNIGIVGEYIFRGFYGKRVSFDNAYYPKMENDYKVYKFLANTCRFGVSFYF